MPLTVSRKAVVPRLEDLEDMVSNLTASGCYRKATDGLRDLDLDAIDLPVGLTCHTAGDWVRHVLP